MKKVLRYKNYDYGTIGERTKFKDKDRRTLYIGDVVEKSDDEGIVTSQAFVVKTDQDGLFIMGIQFSCDENTGDIGGGWNIKFIKSYSKLQIGDKYGCITVEEGIVEDKRFSIGDIVTSEEGRTLAGCIAKIIDIENGRATVKVINSSYGSHLSLGQIDSGWYFDWLIKTEIIEQLNNIVEESVIVGKFKIGDKVKCIKEPGYGAHVEIGDTAVVKCIFNDGDYEIKVDKTGHSQTVRKGSLELITKIVKDIKRFEVIIEGTTTTVKMSNDKEGVAKLYHGEAYNRGYGIVTALGRSLGIDLIADVLKVTKSYEVESSIKGMAEYLESTLVKPNKEEIKEFADRVAFKSIFHVGDKVKMMTSTPKYGSCGVKINDIGEVFRVTTAGNGNPMVRVKFEEAKNLGVDFGDIKLIVEVPKPETPVSFKIGDIVRGKKDNDEYGVTDKNMTKGEIVNIDGETIDIKIIEHEDKIYKEYINEVFYTLDPKYFELVEAASKFEIGCKVKIPKTKLGGATVHSAVIKFAKEKDQDYLFVVRIDKECSHCQYTLSEDIDGYGDYFDLEDLELYKENLVDTLTSSIDSSIQAFVDSTPPYKNPISLDKVESESKPNFKEGDHVRLKKELEGTYGETSKGDTARIKSVSRGFCQLIMDKNNESWGAQELKLELVEEVRLNINFKEGDSVKLTRELGGTDGKTSKGDTAIIKTVNKYDYIITMDKDGRTWYTDDKKLELFIPEVKVGLKEGDKVKMISSRPHFGFGEVKVGDIGVIREILSNEIYVDFPNQEGWSASMKDLELVIEEPRYKIGQEVSRDIAIKIIKNNGKILVKRDWAEDDAEYYLKEGKLIVNFTEGDNCFESGGYDNVRGEKYLIIKLTTIK